MLYGTILSADDTSLTVGETVNLFGPQNDDGSITAQTIQIGTVPQVRPN